MSDKLQFVVDVRLDPSFPGTWNFGNSRQLKEALIQWVFSTVRGSGWPRLNVMSIQVLLISSLEWWPSATADGTE